LIPGWGASTFNKIKNEKENKASFRCYFVCIRNYCNNIISLFNSRIFHLIKRGKI